MRRSLWNWGPCALTLVAPVALAPLPGCTQARPLAQARPLVQAQPVTVPAEAKPEPAANGQPSLGWRVRTRHQLAWGQGLAAVGRAGGSEQNPEAPMSLDVDAEGRLWLLDQVNARVLRLVEGQPTVALKASRTAQELVVGADRVWLLDRLVARQAVALEPSSGKTLASVALNRSDIGEPGALTALQLVDGALWAEVGHAHWQRLADAAGQPTVPARIEGRLSARGDLVLRALRVPTAAGSANGRDVFTGRAVVTGKAAAAGTDAPPVWSAEATFELPVHALEELAGDSQGRVWLVADLVRIDAADQPLERRRVAVVWGADGRELARVELCAPDGPEETLRSARLGHDGKLYNLCVRQAGVTVQEVAP